MPQHGHVLKINRAYDHLKNLNSEVIKRLESINKACTMESDPTHRKYFLFRIDVPDVPQEPISLLIGDMIQNLRNALDHLVYALGFSYTKPFTDEIAKDSQFPIVGDKDRKGDSGYGPSLFQSQSFRIRGIDPTAQAVIQRLQPYNRGKDFEGDPLWRLMGLSNIDKHRLLHIATHYANGATLDLTKSFNFNMGPGDFQTYGGIAKGKTVIARGPFSAVDRSRKMHVHFDAPLFIGFSDGPLAGTNVVDGLGEIYNYVLTEVIPPLEVYL
jgi:hypothetical protein